MNAVPVAAIAAADVGAVGLPLPSQVPHTTFPRPRHTLHGLGVLVSAIKFGMPLCVSTQIGSGLL